jgi:CRP-like cAMP-binding protein
MSTSTSSPPAGSASKRRSVSTNRILAALSAESLRALWPALSRLTLPRGYKLYESGASISHLYFIERGLVSLVKPMRDGRAPEIDAVGREGIAVPSAIFGVGRAAMESSVQIAATVLRISCDDFAARLAADREFSAIVRGYVGVALSQLVQTAACNIVHTVENRCCRWLLFAHDSALSDRFPLTHEFLATLLSVRRASVSLAAAALQRRGFIHYSHGVVTVLDRAGLERSACECHATIRADFEDLFSRAAPPARRSASVRNRTERVGALDLN